MEINQAISQGNAMTRAATEHNQQVQAARDTIEGAYQTKLKGDQRTRDIDKDIFEAHDTIQSLAFGSKYPTWTKSRAQWKDSESLADFGGKQLELGQEKNPLFFKVASGVKQTGQDFVNSLKGDNEPTAPAQEVEMQDASGFSSASREESDVLGADPLYRSSDTAETRVETDATTPDVSESRDLTTETAEEPSLLDKVSSGAADVVEKGAGALRIAGNVGGYIDDADLISHGFKTNKTGWGAAAEYMQGAGALLDTIGIALPVFEPLGAALSLGGAIADTVEGEKKNNQTIKDDPQNLANSLTKQKYVNNTPLENMGAIASQSTHLQNLANPVGTF